MKRFKSITVRMPKKESLSQIIDILLKAPEASHTFNIYLYQDRWNPLGKKNSEDEPRVETLHISVINIKVVKIIALFSVVLTQIFYMREGWNEGLIWDNRHAYCCLDV